VAEATAVSAAKTAIASIAAIAREESLLEDNLLNLSILESALFPPT
jgi:hypothetical protein